MYVAACAPLQSESDPAVEALTWFFSTGGPGVHDPCEREPTDVLSDLSAQQADAITHSAQVSPSTGRLILPISQFY